MKNYFVAPLMHFLATCGVLLPSIEAAQFLQGGSGAGHTALKGEGDRAITQIVKLLKGMLEDSQKEADEEKNLYAKFKCYCDDNTAEKTESIKTLTKQISLLEADIEKLLGSTGLLSKQVAELQAQMDDNTQMRKTAEALREEEKEAFEKAEADMKDAIGQLGQAIEILASVGADQTLEESAEHEQFMAGYKDDSSLLNLKTSVKQALLAANSFVTPKQRRRVESFLQSPFAGSYSSSAGEIFGILSNMKETFESNLAAARSAEEAAAKAHEKLMKTKEEEFKAMEESFKTKQSTMTDNDGSLEEKRATLEEAEKQKADDEEFLEKLLPMCEKKAKEFEERNMLRTQEQAAITQAIAILDSEKAFSTFGKVKATSEGATGFLQLSAVGHSVIGSIDAEMRQHAVKMLLQASHGSSKVLRVMAMLRAGNPFTKVLEAIEDMKELIAKEAKVDKEQFDWCKSERKENNDKKKEKEAQIKELESAITGLEEIIDHPETGLKVLIKQTEDSLVENTQSQAEETKARREENLVYQKNVANMAEATELLQTGIAALEKYYSDLKEEQEKELELMQKKRADPEPPETWSGSYKGQSEQGNKALEMLNFVLKATVDEETAHHDAEQTAQADYEDSMAELKKSEEGLQESLAKSQEELADAEKSLVMKREDLEKTESEKLAIEQYLEKIKPGCDFITDNYEDREKSRGLETEALKKAVTLLKGTPAFTAAKATEKKKSWGKCRKICTRDEAHADCKACLADVSVPGYCAGHPGTAGC